MNLLIESAERGVMPDSLIRLGIRRLDRRRLFLEAHRDEQAGLEATRHFIGILRTSPIAVEVEKPKEQHYEIPPPFFERVLGKRMKYSSCYWPPGIDDLDAAEEAMLQLTCERAELADGMEVLELGCGWGSLSVWIAEKYPKSRVLAVSNSRPQREFIIARARSLSLENVAVETEDMNRFVTDRRFDRVLSVEMFEHMRNWDILLARIASWLCAEGKLFIHIFTHRCFSYFFETEGPEDWMGRHFFTAGMMPSDDLLLHFQDAFVLEDHWRLNGMHYMKTANSWLRRMDAHAREILPVFDAVYGAGEAARWFQRWRIFFMACAELWGFEGGREWLVSHYRMRKR